MLFVFEATARKPARARELISRAGDGDDFDDVMMDVTPNLVQNMV